MIRIANHKAGNYSFQEAVKKKLCANQPFLRKAYKKVTLANLHNDHVNACILLDILDKELANLESGGEPDYLLMRDIIKYMVNYPDTVHHPLEEILFARLEKVDVGSLDSINRLYEEHNDLTFLGDELDDELEKIVAGSIVKKDRLLQLCHKYRELLYSHMKTEEEKVFPRIERIFSITDWSEIKSSLETIEDPLFGEAVLDYYQRLYDRIQSEINQDE